MSVGHGPVIFIWKAAAQLEREKRTTKSCYPTEEKKKKQNRNSGWSYCINGLAKKKNFFSCAVCYWCSRRFSWWPISYFSSVIHFLLSMLKALSIGSWDSISSPDEVFSIYLWKSIGAKMDTTGSCNWQYHFYFFLEETKGGKNFLPTFDGLKKKKK